MQYFININQELIVKNFPGLDVKDALLLDFVSKFCNSGKANYIVKDEEQFFWISYSMVINEMPLLALKTKDAIYRRFKKLSQHDLIEAHPDNQLSGKSYYKFGLKYNDLHFSTPTVKKPSLRSDKRRRTENQTEAPTVKKPYKQLNNIYQYIIINKGKSYSDKVNTLKKRIGETFFKQLLKIYEQPGLPILYEEKGKQFIVWLEYRKEKRKSYIQKSIEKVIELFHTHPTEICKVAVENSISNGYDGIFFKNPEQKITNGNKRKGFEKMVAQIAGDA